MDASPRDFQSTLNSPDIAMVEGISRHQTMRVPDADTLIGQILDIGTTGARLRLDKAVLDQVHTQTNHLRSSRAGLVGALVKIASGDHWLIATIRTVDSTATIADTLFAEVEFLGEGAMSTQGRIGHFQRGVSTYPNPGAHVYSVTEDDAARVYARSDKPSIEVGTVYPTRGVRAALHVNDLLGRHFALVGSTGTGKSTATALILHRICDLAPQGHILLVDPHGEYRAAFPDRSETFDAETLRLPYWLMNLEEHCEILLGTDAVDRPADRDILSRCLLAARQKLLSGRAASRVTADTPVPYLLADLSAALQTEMGTLDKVHDLGPYLRIKRQLEALRTDRRFAFLFSGVLVADTMAEVISGIFRLPAKGRPISILDLSAVPAELVSIVVALLARLAMEYSVWARTEARSPILFVCEEAHRYIPAKPTGQQASAGRILSRIAKEGRKYGVALGLVTQRPSDLAPDILSQCGTLISLRLSNERDQALIRAAMPEGGRSLLDAVPALRNRECIVCGEGVNLPLRLTFDELSSHCRPASDDPAFLTAWASPDNKAAMIDRSLRRWRGQEEG